MTSARAAAPATGQMVICVGLEAKTVYIDAEGQPTEAPHLCADCILVFAAVPLGNTAEFHQSLVQELVSANRAAHLEQRCLLKGYFSRAPP